MTVLAREGPSCWGGSALVLTCTVGCRPGPDPCPAAESSPPYRELATPLRDLPSSHRNSLLRSPHPEPEPRGSLLLCIYLTLHRRPSALGCVTEREPLRGLQ